MESFKDKKNIKEKKTLNGGIERGGGEVREGQSIHKGGENRLSRREYFSKGKKKNLFEKVGGKSQRKGNSAGMPQRRA